ncbi:MAG: hypothetical protein DMD96_10345 [Candidatus Rokuibacteriota bacterium]|nr:MAG: hypothetical protein DMD96_10345 [Candidatus Rokubacteria bacterium]
MIPKPDAQEGAKASGRSLDETIEDIERQMILGALSRAGRVQVHLARLPGITAQSRWYRIKKSGIQARVAGTLPPLLAAPGAWAPCSPPPLCPSN